MTESTIQKQIIDYLKAAGHIVLRMNSGMAAKNIHLCPPGTPDLLTVSPSGKVTWVEIKTATGKLRPAQVDMICDLKARKQEIIIARSLSDVSGKEWVF